MLLGLINQRIIGVYLAHPREDVLSNHWRKILVGAMALAGILLPGVGIAG